MSKTYILQKDLPDGAKIGDRYIKGEYRYYNERIHAEAKGIIESANWETWQVENNPEWFLPEENKSNDSFQWTSDLKGIYISELEKELFKNGMLPESFRKKFVDSHTPKPQADNGEIKKTTMDKTMFEEMEGAGSKLPHMVAELQLCGWVTHKHHDNWIKLDWRDDPNVDNMGLDTHEAYKKITEMPATISILSKYLREDKSPGSYYYSWQANIAMCFFDEFKKWVINVPGTKIPDTKQLHRISNLAAKNFLNMLINKTNIDELTGQPQADGLRFSKESKVGVALMSEDGNIQKVVMQAENKPDWEIVALEEDGHIFEKSCEVPPEGFGGKIKFTSKTHVGFLTERNIGSPTIKIHSVKRLSDGEVLTCGESGYYKRPISEKDIWFKISKFEIHHGEMWAFETGSDGLVVEPKRCNINQFKKLPPQPQKEEQEALRFKYDVTLKDADAFLKANNLYTQQQVDAMCEKAATDFIHYTEFVMNDDSWLCEDGMKSMSDVYKEFVQWKNSKQ